MINSGNTVPVSSRRLAYQLRSISASGIVIAFSILLVSWIRHPSLFEVEVSELLDNLPVRTVVELYRRGGTIVYVTGADLLHPESFGKAGEFIQSVALGYSSDAQKQGQTPGWNRQVLYALTLRDYAGDPLGSVDLNETDRQLSEEWGKSFPMVAGVPTQRRLQPGDIYIFELPEGSSYRVRSGLRTIMAIGYAGADDPSGSKIAYLLSSRQDVSGIGIPYMHLSALGIADADIEANFAALLSAVDDAIRSSAFRVVVIGTWAKRSNMAQAQTRGFVKAWSAFRGTLRRHASMPVQESLRLACIALVAAFAGAMYRQEKITWLTATAFFLAAGAALTTGFWLLTWLEPLYLGLFPAWLLLALKLVISVVAGWHLRRLALLDYRKILAGNGAS